LTSPESKKEKSTAHWGLQRQIVQPSAVSHRRACRVCFFSFSARRPPQRSVRVSMAAPLPCPPPHGQLGPGWRSRMNPRCRRPGHPRRLACFYARRARIMPGLNHFGPSRVFGSLAVACIIYTFSELALECGRPRGAALLESRTSINKPALCDDVFGDMILPPVPWNYVQGGHPMRSSFGFCLDPRLPACTTPPQPPIPKLRQTEFAMHAMSPCAPVPPRQRSVYFLTRT